MNRINTTNCRQDAHRSSRLLAATVASGFSLCFFVAALSPALAEEQAVWRPAPTERLVKLPGAYLKKAIERDFSESGLVRPCRRYWRPGRAHCPQGEDPGRFA